MDSCNPAEGCEHVDISKTCDDYNECTDDWCCVARGCVFDPITCDDYSNVPMMIVSMNLDAVLLISFAMIIMLVPKILVTLVTDAQISPSFATIKTLVLLMSVILLKDVKLLF